jgi:predicted HicB family RNase H-like nuclease
MSTMSYKGYVARITYEADDELFVGRLAGIDDIVSFDAETVSDLKAAFHEAVDDYVETCAKIGKTPERPFSGKVMFRVPPKVHAQAALAAELSGRSLNQWAEEVLRETAARDLQRLKAA